MSLAPKQQEKIFAPFSRTHRRDVEGDSLGLAIVRLIVRRLGDETTVQSLLGKSSTFEFSLKCNKTMRHNGEVE